MNLVLVDTSIWIDFFNQNQFNQEINQLALEKRLATCGLIKTELFPFFKKEKKDQEDFFNSMEYFSFHDTYWKLAIQLQESLLKAGYQLAIPDLVITTICKEMKCFLFSKDKIFDQTKKITGIKIYEN